MLAKGKLSPRLVQSVVDLAMANMTVRVPSLDAADAGQTDTQLATLLFKVTKKATAPNKLSALYLLDAVAREARSLAKKQGKGKSTAKPAEPPVQGVETPGTPATFLLKLENLLSKLVLDVWENGPLEHRVSAVNAPDDADQRCRTRCARCSTSGSRRARSTRPPSRASRLNSPANLPPRPPSRLGHQNQYQVRPAPFSFTSPPPSLPTRSSKHSARHRIEAWLDVANASDLPPSSVSPSPLPHPKCSRECALKPIPFALQRNPTR